MVVVSRIFSRAKTKEKKRKKKKKREESEKIRRLVNDFVVSRDRFESFALTNDKKFNPINNPIDIGFIL